MPTWCDLVIQSDVRRPWPNCPT